MPPSRRFAVLLALTAGLLLPASAAFAHEEREVTLPDGTGSVPAYRTAEPDLLVCKSDLADFRRRIAGFPEDLKTRNIRLFEKCQQDGFRHLQEAVDKVDRPGMTIGILPGLYREEPSQAAPSGACAALPARWSVWGYQILSYEQQQQCPHNQNLVAVLGKKDLQIEGTGADPLDVVIDAEYRKLNAIRADRADGIYFRNFTAQRTTFNAVYILETDGFVIDRVLGRWTDEYGFLTFASDHGLYTDCEAYGNGDGGLYPGSASNINEGRGHDVTRYAIEIRRCKSHHNALGYSGTAGDSMYVHDNEFYANMVGATMDSLWPGHPGLPQNHARFENNKIYDNNADYYRYLRDGTCRKPPAERGYERGVVCPQVGVPSGTGILVAGGNYNVFANNEVTGHRRAAFQLFGVPAVIRGEDDLAKQADTSNHNRYEGNRFAGNGLDVWWDGQGTGNCFQGDTGRSTPAVLPVCGDRAPALSGGSSRLLAEPVKLAKLYLCADFSAAEARLPAGCDWFGASGLGKLEAQLALGGSIVLGLLAILFAARARHGTLLNMRARSNARTKSEVRSRSNVLGRPDVRNATLGVSGTLPDAPGVSGAESDVRDPTPGLHDQAPARRHSIILLAATAAGLLGLALDVVAAVADAPVLAGLAVLGLGAWMLALGLLLRRARPVFGWFTAVIGLLGLADAADRLVHLIPAIPLSPGWIRGLLTGIWVLWAVVVLAPRPSRTRGEERHAPKVLA
ncbi:right-handed parallel beta-helix repeat-containing protein [Thermoactinospora rubra]|uniref:right-handed parallel beta-helix repeat-containing protein n=1 Tax=Thermoactinospora rubra TaxID=1088767 RepID=UPI0019800EA3|nr:right-handed parallel beta-helix repeat-containing protein [Thermoactinospora rubra]